MVSLETDPNVLSLHPSPSIILSINKICKNIVKKKAVNQQKKPKKTFSVDFAALA